MGNDLAALAVFETVRPKSGAKFGAIMTLLECGVPEQGIAALIARAPWPEEGNKRKWRAQLAKLARKAVVCPFCLDEPEVRCPVSKYMRTDEAHLTAEEIDTLPDWGGFGPPAPANARVLTIEVAYG